jgi:hypothetical protein
LNLILYQENLTMKNLPVLFLFVLLAACAPAITEVPGPTDAPIATNTPAPTATATLAPSPTPTESPEEAAARLAQDVLNGNITNLADLDEQQRSAVVEILAEHIPELAAMVIHDQNIYAELTAGWDIEMRKALAIEIAEQINANKEISYKHTALHNIQMAFDENTGRWWPITLLPGTAEKGRQLKEISPKAPNIIRVFAAGFSVSTEDSGLRHYILSEKTGEWIEVEINEYQMFITEPNDPRLSNTWHNVFPENEDHFVTMGGDFHDILSNYFKEKRGVLLFGDIDSTFEKGFPFPSEHGLIERSTNISFYENFPGFYIRKSEMDKNGNLLGFVRLSLFIDFGSGPRKAKLIDQNFIPVSGDSYFMRPTGSGSNLKLPRDWNRDHNSQEGKQIAVLAFDAVLASQYSAVGRRNDVKFPPEMMTMQEFYRLLDKDGNIDLEKLMEAKKFPAFGALMVAVEK